MPRRIVYCSAEIYRLRGVYWNRYYQYRAFARNVEVDPIRVLNALVGAGMPENKVQVDGSIYAPKDVIHASHGALNALGLRNTFVGNTEISITWLDMMCSYFWSESGWMEYVRRYEALPDPVEDHYLFYDAERDGGLLVPMSSKPKRRVVPKTVDNSVDKLGTSQEQVAELYLEKMDFAVRE